jgi:hypothetical protein
MRRASNANCFISLLVEGGTTSDQRPSGIAANPSIVPPRRRGPFQSCLKLLRWQLPAWCLTSSKVDYSPYQQRELADVIGPDNCTPQGGKQDTHSDPHLTIWLRQNEKWLESGMQAPMSVPREVQESLIRNARQLRSDFYYNAMVSCGGAIRSLYSRFKIRLARRKI